MRLAAELRLAGESVIVVTDSATETDRERLAAIGAGLAEGSPLHESVLRRAGVGSARCIAAVEDDDVGNLRIGFAAHKVNPNIRVVLRLFNEDMGERIQALFHDCVILSASAIAAPFFAAAAVGHVEGHRIAAAGHALLVTHVEAAEQDDDESGRIVTGLAHTDSNGNVTLFPVDPQVNDLVLRDLGPFEEVDPVLASSLIPKKHKTFRSRFWESAVTLRALLDHRFRVLMLTILLIVVVTTAFFAYSKGITPMDSLYFTVVTLSGVGYGDYNLRYDPYWVKIYGMAFILVGVTFLAIFYSLLVDALVGIRLARALGTVHSRINGHVIICGLGNIGFRVSEHLSTAGHSVVVIDRNEHNRHLPAIRRLGVPVVIGDASLSETLHAAHVETARSLVACTDDDIIDLESAVNARSLHPDLPIVLRLFDDDISRRVEQHFSIRFSRSMSSLSAPVFATEMLRHAVVASIPVGHNGAETVLIAELEVEAGSLFDGIAVSELEITGRNKVVAITRLDEEPEWMPFGTATTLAANDRILLATTRDDWNRLIEGAGAG